MNLKEILKKINADIEIVFTTLMIGAAVFLIGYGFIVDDFDKKEWYILEEGMIAQNEIEVQ